jgi:hypothetical protein
MGLFYARSPGRQVTAHLAYSDCLAISGADRKICEWIDSSDTISMPALDRREMKLDPAPLSVDMDMMYYILKREFSIKKAGKEQ